MRDYIRDASPASPLLTAGAITWVVLTSGDLRIACVILAVVVSMPVSFVVLFLLLVSMTGDWGENESARLIPRRVAIQIGLGICLAPLGG